MPDRTPIFCAGCPHRGTLYWLKKVVEEKLRYGVQIPILGDIGCYGIGFMPPFRLVDTFIAMGQGGSLSFGMNERDRFVTIVGDSTLIHSGMNAIRSAVANKHKIAYIIADNKTVGMTGHQPNLITGSTISGGEVEQMNLESLVRSLGVRYVDKGDPLKREFCNKTNNIIERDMTEYPVAVLIADRACALAVKKLGLEYEKAPPFHACGICAYGQIGNCHQLENLSKTIGCPAFTLEESLLFSKDKLEPQLDESRCFECGFCNEVVEAYPCGIQKRLSKKIKSALDGLEVYKQ